MESTAKLSLQNVGRSTYRVSSGKTVRSAITGQYVAKDVTLKHPKTTMRESHRAKGK